MKPEDQKRSIDQLLDAGLRHYSHAQPRLGLEGRVLARLHAERKRIVQDSWWPEAAVLATVALIALAAWVAGKPGGISGIVGAPHSGSPATDSRPDIVLAPAPAASAIVRSPSPRHRARKSRLREPLEVASAPKLDQFPSPRPLSEQERLLAHYVAQYANQAVLVARARTEFLQRQEQLDQITDTEEPSNLQASER
jgi:hypothetical protein